MDGGWGAGLAIFSHRSNEGNQAFRPDPESLPLLASDSTRAPTPDRQAAGLTYRVVYQHQCLYRDFLGSGEQAYRHCIPNLRHIQVQKLGGR
jgi:hypothetical protein